MIRLKLVTCILSFTALGGDIALSLFAASSSRFSLTPIVDISIELLGEQQWPLSLLPVAGLYFD